MKLRLAPSPTPPTSQSCHHALNRLFHNWFFFFSDLSSLNHSFIQVSDSPSLHVTLFFILNPALPLDLSFRLSIFLLFSRFWCLLFIDKHALGFRFKLAGLLSASGSRVCQHTYTMPLIGWSGCLPDRLPVNVEPPHIDSWLRKPALLSPLVEKEWFNSLLNSLFSYWTYMWTGLWSFQSKERHIARMEIVKTPPAECQCDGALPRDGQTWETSDCGFSPRIKQRFEVSGSRVKVGSAGDDRETWRSVWTSVLYVGSLWWAQVFQVPDRYLFGHIQIIQCCRSSLLSEWSNRQYKRLSTSAMLEECLTPVSLRL